MLPRPREENNNKRQLTCPGKEEEEDKATDSSYLAQVAALEAGLKLQSCVVLVLEWRADILVQVLVSADTRPGELRARERKRKDTLLAAQQLLCEAGRKETVHHERDSCHAKHAKCRVHIQS